MGALAIVGIIMTLAATAYSGYSQYQAANTAADQAKKNAAYNAALARQHAIEEERARLARERTTRDQMRRRRAGIQARYAKSGVLLEGTPAQWLSEQAAVDEFNLATMSREGRKRVLSARDAEAMYLARGNQQATAYKLQGQTALISAFTSGMNGAASWLSLMPGSSGGGGGGGGASSPQAGNTLPYM